MGLSSARVVHIWGLGAGDVDLLPFFLVICRLGLGP